MPNVGAQSANGRHVMNNRGTLTAEGWAAVVVLGSLALLIAIRMGFRGVSVLGARVSVD